MINLTKQELAYFQVLITAHTFATAHKLPQTEDILFEKIAKFLTSKGLTDKEYSEMFREEFKRISEYTNA